MAASKYPEIARAIRDTVSASHGLALSFVCLLQTRSIPKTTSGKIARAWCRRGFVENTLQVVYKLDAEKEVENEVGGQEEDTPGGSSAKNVNGYAKVSTSDPASTTNTTAGAAAPVVPVALPTVTGRAHTAEEVRALPLAEIAKQLEDLLLQVAAQGPSPLTGPLDQHMPVTAMGLDSMTLVQFKGVLEKR